MQPTVLCGAVLWNEMMQSILSVHLYLSALDIWVHESRTGGAAHSMEIFPIACVTDSTHAPSSGRKVKGQGQLNMANWNFESAAPCFKSTTMLLC